MSKFSVILVLMFSYPFIFVHDADSRAERVEFPTSCLSFIRLFFYASFCRFGRFRFGCIKKVGSG